MQRLKQGTSPYLANLLSLVGGPPTDIVLNRIQSCDPFQSFSSQRRGVGLFEVIELAANVRPASHLLNPIIFIELIETCVGICLQRTLKRPQMLLGVFASAIGRVRKPYCRSSRIARWSVVAN